MLAPAFTHLSQTTRLQDDQSGQTLRSTIIFLISATRVARRAKPEDTPTMKSD